MYIIKKKMEIAGAHALELPYDSKCSTIHGHNWLVEIKIVSDELTKYGMVIDFTHLKKKIHDKLDHQYLNVIIGVNPTAENIAKWIADELNELLEERNPSTYVESVTVQESEGNVAQWIRD